MRGRVPLASRNLLAEPRRLAASAAGVGMAVMLILLLDGLWAGIEANITTYEDHVGADLFVAQPGTRNFFGAISVLPDDTLETVEADPDVEWAARVRGFFSIVELHDTKVPTYVIGSVPGGRGGPWNLHSGRAPEADGEVAVGSVMARRHGLSLGDHLDVMGTTFTIVGTTDDAFMASFVFTTHDATDRLLSSPATTSFVLVGTDNPEAVRGRIEAIGLAVLDRDELAKADLALMSRAYRVPLAVMRAVAFAIGSIVIALTVYTAIADRRREYGIVKAMGARPGYLSLLALEQSLLLAAAGLITAGFLFLGARALIGELRPQFVIVTTFASVGRAVAVGLAMGVIASLVPARRLTRLQPAVAYRGS